jgi:2-keto-4-pentenoate hydratase/2-oxohepta-3-ene-1,7-dioic acid hydratase in catechol pathway
LTHSPSTERQDLGPLAGAPWALVSYTADAAPVRAGILDSSGAVRSLDRQLGIKTLLELLGDWNDASHALASLDVTVLDAVPEAVLDIPVRLPSKLIFAGANYYAHAQEMGTPVPAGVRPFFFLKPPSTTLVPDGVDIAVHSGPKCRIDWEAELGVVIGRRGKSVTREDAWALVAGYVVINDITDRSRLARPQPILGPQFAFDWLSAKAIDASCPIGSGFVPSHLVPDPHDLAVRLWVNGELKQNGTTADMVTDIASLIEAASATMTLEPGDIIATGTPAGVGAGRGEFLQPGDVVTAEVITV